MEKMGHIQVIIALVCQLGYVHGQRVEIFPQVTNNYLLVGSPLTLTCRYTYPNTATMEQIDFYKGSSTLISEQNDFGFERTMKQEIATKPETTTTTILNISKNVTGLGDGGQYECRLSSTRATAAITVHIFQITSEGAELVPYSNYPLTLRCTHDIEPATLIKITWKHNNETLENGTKYSIFENNGSLVIKNPARSDMGDYTCVLNFNPTSVVESQKVVSSPIAVKAGPKIDQHDNNKNMVQGGTVELHCTVSGYPIPTVTWTKDGLKVNVSVRHHFLSYGGTEAGLLKIFALELEDKGVYSCLASNKINPFNATAEIHLNVTGCITYISMPSFFLCRLTRRHIGITLSAAAASGFPCPEPNFVTVGPNDSKLGMHVSGSDSKCSAQERSNKWRYKKSDMSSEYRFDRCYVGAFIRQRSTCHEY